MEVVTQGKALSHDALLSFLDQVSYRRFDGWPGVDRASVSQHLLRQIEDRCLAGGVLSITQKGQIVALLASRKLDWDSQHFGFHCSSIDYLLTRDSAELTLVRDSLACLLAAFTTQCQSDGTHFVAADIDSWDSDVGVALQDSHFKYVLSWIDGVVRPHDKIPEAFGEGKIGLIKSDEIDHFAAMSTDHYFHGGRFYLDKCFEQPKVKAMYANIVESSVKANDILLVYRISGRPVGLFICKKVQAYPAFEGLRVAPLRFLIVDPQYRKGNVGLNLYIETLKYLRSYSDLITTGLEIHNLPSLNLHSKTGFRYTYTHNVYHWWNKGKQ